MGLRMLRAWLSPLVALRVPRLCGGTGFQPGQRQMFWVTGVAPVSAVRGPDAIPAQAGVCGCLFVLREEPPARPGARFMFPDVSLNPEIWEEVPPNVAAAPAAKEHPTPFLRVKISLFSYADSILFKVGAAKGGRSS